MPAAPSQLVSESDMILGYRGPGGYQGGKNENTASDTGPGGGATDTGPSFTGDSIGPSAPQDLGFIGSGPTVNPNLENKVQHCRPRTNRRRRSRSRLCNVYNTRKNFT